jgi:hypothetical protein
MEENQMTADRIRELEAELAALVKTRNETVNDAKQVIEWANQSFDARAVPLRRELERLRLEQIPPEPAKPKPKPKAKAPTTEEMVAFLEKRGIDVEK